MSTKSKKEVLGMSSLSHKFQVTIPKKVREEANLKEGDKIMFVREDGQIHITKTEL
ncbi:AbrB/MazE/SpoVT family DNA-binding domain-containing protein [Nitrosarchaeum sp. AC2]|uniref:AbrB/MazE/SpoVT family DNA-binding domain-containing protein n=1 Tax=Nitrosarchaeum sp. AC2 TaxID=2259673 RepID=UPI0015C82751|nr:AbrB/MazE/SpoVT family DNA-binding domain-containing protein [Nitrosarchaeum sp. AC2]QLH11278.1 AbrB/MazE/SpoVT family DNA-binding domain-containing protein [Nitrosarchaeum sp. AC2]